MPVGGYPLAMYGMAALTTAVLAYATISSGSSDNAGASASSAVEKSGEGMLSGLFGSSSKSDASSSSSSDKSGGIMESLGNAVSSVMPTSTETKADASPPSPSPANPTTGGGATKKKNKKTKRRKGGKKRSDKNRK